MEIKNKTRVTLIYGEIKIYLFKQYTYFILKQLNKLTKTCNICRYRLLQHIIFIIIFSLHNKAITTLVAHKRMMLIKWSI